MRRPLVLVVGVRPQYIKAAALLWEFRRHGVADPVHVVDTGQHYSPELANRIHEELDLRVALRVLHRPHQSAAEILATSIGALAQFLGCHEPRPTVVVFGDANPTLAGSVAALKSGCSLVHVEAGARRDPIEQEHHNSRMVDSIADLKLCVTVRAIDELERENNSAGAVLTGDMAAEWFRNRAPSQQPKPPNDGSILVTLHRAENATTERIGALLAALRRQSRPVVWVEHPRTSGLLQELGARDEVQLLPPQGFGAILRVVAGSHVVITDSGGLSREASLLRKPVLMRRDRGGWPELIESGQMKRVGLTAQALMSGLRWADRVAAHYPNDQPLVVERGIEAGIKAIQQLRSTEVRRSH